MITLEPAAAVYKLAPEDGIIGHVSCTVQPAIKTFVPSRVNSKIRSPIKLVLSIEVDDSPKNPKNLFGTLNAKALAQK
jgi:hypothetical protein